MAQPRNVNSQLDVVNCEGLYNNQVAVDWDNNDFQCLVSWCYVAFGARLFLVFFYVLFMYTRASGKLDVVFHFRLRSKVRNFFYSLSHEQYIS